MSGRATIEFDRRLAELHVLLQPLTESGDPSPSRGKELARTLSWEKIDTACTQIFLAFSQMLEDRTSFPLDRRSPLALTIFTQLNAPITFHETSISAEDSRALAQYQVQELYTRCFKPGEKFISCALEDPCSLDPIATPALIKETKNSSKPGELPFVISSIEKSSVRHFQEKNIGPSGLPLDLSFCLQGGEPHADQLLSKLLLVRDALGLFETYHVFPSLQEKAPILRYATPIRHSMTPRTQSGCCCSIL